MSERCEASALLLPSSICHVLTRKLTRAEGLDDPMSILESVRQQLLGEGLLTVNVDVTSKNAGDDQIELQRVWSSRPDAYPVSGRKRKLLTFWTRKLLLDAEMFVGEGDDALADVFDDSTLIRSMGLHAVVNVPLIDKTGRCFATFNVLGTRSRWTERDILLIELLAAFAQPIVREAQTSVVAVKNHSI